MSEKKKISNNQQNFIIYSTIVRILMKKTTTNIKFPMNPKNKNQTLDKKKIVKIKKSFYHT